MEDSHGKFDKKIQKLMTLAEAREKAAQIIESRELREAKLASVPTTTDDKDDIMEDLEYHFAQVEKVEASVTASGAPKPKVQPKQNPKRKAASKKKEKADRSNHGGGRAPSPARSLAPTSVGDAPGPEVQDDLASVTRAANSLFSWTSKKVVFFKGSFSTSKKQNTVSAV